MKNSYLISFEGIECSGKSTQVQKLTEYLNKSTSYTTTLLREPGSSPIGEKIRNILLDPNNEINDLSELLLFLSARAQLINSNIAPLLNTPGNIIILDRFLHSSIAYQGAGRKLGVDFVRSLHDHAFLNLKPDLTIYLDIPISELKDRMNKRDEKKDRLESLSEDFFTTVRNAYLECESKDKYFHTLDAKRSIDFIHTDIINLCSKVGIKVS